MRCKYCGDSSGILNVCKACKPFSQVESLYLRGVKHNNEKDTEQAFQCFSEAAKVGHPKACIAAAKIILERHDNYTETAANYLNKAVPYHEPEASFLLGELYLDNKIASKNRGYDALKYFCLAENEGHLLATRHIADMYYQGKLIEKNYEEAYNRYLKLINEKQVDAPLYNNLGWMYYFGYFVEKNKETAFDYFKKANKLDPQNIYACDFLGYMYYYGLGTQKSSKKALPYVQVAARSNLSSACYILGIMYRDGDVVKKDPLKAVQYLKIAADKNKKEAIIDLAHLYNNDSSIYESPQQIFEATKKAADNGDPDSCYRVAERYVKENVEEAFSYYKTAADGGIINACAKLANLYYLGHGPSHLKDTDQTKKYLDKVGDNLEKVSENGIYCLIGSLYSLLGELERAEQFLNKAIEYGLFDAYLILAEIAENRDDYEKAFKMYEKSVEKGPLEDKALAYGSLARLYLNGLGVAKDIDKAKECCDYAISNGDISGCLLLGQILYDEYIQLKNSNKELAAKTLSSCYSNLKKASDAGYSDAKKMLVDILLYEKNPARYDIAAKYLEELYSNSYNNEDFLSHTTLIVGKAYAEGKKVDFDFEKAQSLLTISKSLGNAEAVEEISQLNNRKIDQYFTKFIGMKSVKDEIKGIYAAINSGIPFENYNFLVYGNPGTGKTEVARVIAKIFSDLGIRNDKFIETGADKIVSIYHGGYEANMQKLLTDAEGGVFYLDEAYNLYQSEKDVSGKKALELMMKHMEDNRDKLTVILTGYKKEMHRMIRDVNPGLESRISFKIEIPNYSNEELVQIAHIMVANKKDINGKPLGMKIEDGADSAIIKSIQKVRVDEATFGNAREVRNIVDEALKRYSKRITKGDPNNKILLATDFWEGEVVVLSKDDPITELNNLIGLQSVKKQVNEMVELLNYQKLLNDQGIHIDSVDGGRRHMMFLGNPGTGKTQVARLIAKIYMQMGVLKKGNFVEVSRKDLVGEYFGQTAPKTANAVKDALGGILFIDEAYTLYNEKAFQGDYYGQECIETLMKLMEDNKENLIVIFAGYKDKMDRFLEINSGLKSRISKELIFDFEDYSRDELGQIIDLNLNKMNITIEPEAKELFLDDLEKRRVSEGTSFGNARLCDGDALAPIIKNKTLRCARNHITDPKLINQIIAEDVEKFLDNQSN